MTNLKKLIVLFVLFSFYSQATFSQMEMATAPETRLSAGNQVVDVYIPPDPSLMSVIDSRDVQIIVNFIEEVEGVVEWTPDRKGAFNYAKGLWEQMLTSTSDIKIYIDAKIDDIGGNDLAVGKAGTIICNFGSSDPTYQPDTWYSIALANRLHGMDMTNIVDVKITVSRENLDKFSYNTNGECPDDKYDFVTTILHEIGHGVGFSSSVDGNGEEAKYGKAATGGIFPNIYDRYIINEDGVKLTDFAAGEITTELNDYLESDALLWANTGSDASGAKIYAPSSYEDGRSVSHLDEDTYTNIANGLFTPELDKSEAIHSPGTIGIAILKDIGWDAQLIVGLEDDLELYGFDPDCLHAAPDCPFSDPNDFITTPKLEYNIGETGYYYWKFDDLYPISGLYSIDWKVELLHSQGRYIHSTGISNPDYTVYDYFGITIGSLPTGYQWDRNGEGQIKAELIISGTDTDGIFHEESIPLSINYQPDIPDVEFLYKGCNSVTLSFYAPGATSYNVFMKSEDDDSWILLLVPQGHFSYEITWLDRSKDYDFMVEGINDYGMVTSEIVQRNKCGTIVVTGFPNPTTGVFTVSSVKGETIKNISLHKIGNPNLRTRVIGDGYSNKLRVDLRKFPKGLYDVQVTDIKGNIGNKTIFKH